MKAVFVLVLSLVLCQTVVTSVPRLSSFLDMVKSVTSGHRTEKPILIYNQMAEVIVKQGFKSATFVGWDGNVLGEYGIELTPEEIQRALTLMKTDYKNAAAKPGRFEFRGTHYLFVNFVDFKDFQTCQSEILAVGLKDGNGFVIEANRENGLMLFTTFGSTMSARTAARITSQAINLTV